MGVARRSSGYSAFFPLQPLGENHGGTFMQWHEQVGWSRIVVVDGRKEELCRGRTLQLKF